MKIVLSLTRCGLGVCAAVMILVGCGESQSVPSGQQSAAEGVTAAQTLPASTSAIDLLYGSTGSGKVFVATFPQGKYMGTLHVPGGKTIGLC